MWNAEKTKDRRGIENRDFFFFSPYRVERLVSRVSGQMFEPQLFLYDSSVATHTHTGQGSASLIRTVPAFRRSVELRILQDYGHSSSSRTTRCGQSLSSSLSTRVDRNAGPSRPANLDESAETTPQGLLSMQLYDRHRKAHYPNRKLKID